MIVEKPDERPAPPPGMFHSMPCDRQQALTDSGACICAGSVSDLRTYTLDTDDLLRCLGRLFVPTDGTAYNTDLKWKVEGNVLTVTLEVGPPKEDGVTPDVLNGTGPDLLRPVVDGD